MMRAIVLKDKQYHLQEVAKPEPKSDEVLVKVAYAGVNRADLYQQQGKYPQPENGIPGMEISGEIVAFGSTKGILNIGDKVCALTGEGAFAEYVSVPFSMLLPISGRLEMDDAAALPEACFTGWVNLVDLAWLYKDETVLIHGGAGNIGPVIIQIAQQLGARVFATAGTDEKCAAINKLGARAINYRTEDFVEVIKQETAGKGVDIILDAIGGDYFARNLASLARNGRLCIIAFIKGSHVDVNLSPVLLKGLRIFGSTIRSYSLEEKGRTTTEIYQGLSLGNDEENGIKPLISRVFPLEDAEKALQYMDQGLNIGKILLKI